MTKPGRKAQALAAALTVAGVVSLWEVLVPRAGDLLDDHAREYIRLVEALDVHEPGTIEWRIGGAPGTAAPPAVSEIGTRAAALAAHLRSRHGDEHQPGRRRHLIRETEALAKGIAHRSAGTPNAGEELALVLDGAARPLRDRSIETIRTELDALLPGSGSLAARLAAFEERFLIPPRRIPAVIGQALAACRAETRRHIRLPAEESVIVDYVRGRPWLGYARYLGGFQTAMEVNLDFPISVDRAITLACHEAYPGHHVYNVVREQRFVRERGWFEFTVMPARGPMSFAAEAFATFAGSVALSEDMRRTLAADVLFPLAALPPDEAGGHIRVARLVERLDVAIADVSFQYLSGDLDRREAADWLEREALMAHSEATLAFVDRYRVYALAYTIGRAHFAQRAAGRDVWPVLTAAMLD